MFNFKVNATDTDTIAILAKRAASIAGKHGVAVSVIDFMMSLTAAHATNPLNLPALLTADDVTFSHDVFGIHRFVNHVTGQLDHAFRPRTTDMKAAA